MQRGFGGRLMTPDAGGRCSASSQATDVRRPQARLAGLGYLCAGPPSGTQVPEGRASSFFGAL
eukprot:15479972-Alexandrium_andersonii.AAC.1